jgi:A/G-specific adenine glycosylase
MSNSLLYNHLYAWYESNRRVLPWRETEDAYAIWLSEVILQQTRVAQGLEYYLRFIARWPRVEDLAAADEAEVLREWQGLGYYSRARNLHKAAKQIVESQESKAKSQELRVIFPRTFEEIRALPGIGDYTAGAIASFAYNAPYPAMDGNVYRVVARLFDIDEAFDTTAGKKLFHRQIETLLDRDNPRLFNSAIMEFGALYCTPVLGDNCTFCPLKECCAAYAHGTAELLPVRKPRPKVRDRWFTYHIYLSTEDRIQSTDLFTLIRRREEKDIWYHLYEFPCEESNGEGLTVKGEGLTVKGEGLTVNGERVIELTHVLSHQKIHARFVVHKVQKMPEIAGTLVIRWEELNDYALSRLTLRALDTMRHTV